MSSKHNASTENLDTFTKVYLMQKKEIETFYPTSQKAWRQWLKKHHRLKQSIWIIYYKKETNKPSLTWSKAVDEALCFGWIDSTVRSVDEEKFMQFFSKRKANSSWSKINKAKVERLIEQGLMTDAGLKTVEIAKQNSSWTILDSVEALTIPKDLAAALKSRPGSKKYFVSLSKSVQKSILQWVVLAKRPETRKKRIVEIATLAAKGQKPKQF